MWCRRPSTGHLAGRCKATATQKLNFQSSCAYGWVITSSQSCNIRRVLARLSSVSWSMRIWTSPSSVGGSPTGRRKILRAAVFTRFCRRADGSFMFNMLLLMPFGGTLALIFCGLSLHWDVALQKIRPVGCSEMLMILPVKFPRKLAGFYSRRNAQRRAVWQKTAAL